jgi:hypothetical protein
MNSEHERIKCHYKPLFERVSKILFEADPIHINFVSNTDEYDPEVGTILPRLEGAHSQEDVRTIVFEEFCRWFGLHLARRTENYDPVAKRIWEEWCKYKAETQ